MAIHYTVNFNFPYPDYDDEPFIESFQNAIIQIDEVLGTVTSITGLVVTAWDNSTAYVINDKVLDGDTQRMYIANVNHTSISAPSDFADDRAAHPTYWTAFGTPFTARGAWAQSTVYSVLDHVYDTTEGVSAVCVTGHTSTATGTIRTDAVKWAFIVDLQATLNQAALGQVLLAVQIFGP